MGGFFGNPEAGLLTRWYQIGAFQPFFRGHAHIDTKRREPWLFGEPHTGRIRAAIRERYRLLPYVYTVFWEAHSRGWPVLRALVLAFPRVKALWTEDQSFMLGNNILVIPDADWDVDGSEKGKVDGNDSGNSTATTADQILELVEEGRGAWFDWWTGRRISHPHRHGHGLDRPPVFARPGAVVPVRERVRRSAALGVHDPITLLVFPDIHVSSGVLCVV